LANLTLGKEDATEREWEAVVHKTIVLAAVDGTLERARSDALDRLLAAAERRLSASEALAHADCELADAVHDAREFGVPWETIAGSVGMTRQALAKKLGTV